MKKEYEELMNDVVTPSEVEERTTAKYNEWKKRNGLALPKADAIRKPDAIRTDKWAKAEAVTDKIMAKNGYEWDGDDWVKQ